MKFYKVVFDNGPNTRLNKDDDETVSICILGERKPTKEEAEHFCAADMKMMHVTDVVDVDEICRWKAERFFDLTEENIPKYPVFRGEPVGRRQNGRLKSRGAYVGDAPKYADFYEFARLLKKAGKEICGDHGCVAQKICIDGILANAAGIPPTLPSLTIRTQRYRNSSCRSIRLSTDINSYALLYSDTPDRGETFKSRCYPRLRELTAIVRDVYEGRRNTNVSYHFCGDEKNIDNFISSLSEAMQEIVHDFLRLNMTAEEVMQKCGYPV